MCVNTENFMNSGGETIQQFYAGKNVFITGATGFIGKALMEKLMRSCPDIRTLYLLVRPKRGESLDDRLNKILSNPLFDRVKHEQSLEVVKSKIYVVAGDIAQIDLGISKEDHRILIENVNLVFHAAATVNFNEPLAIATKLNLRATRDVCRMALKMKKLRAFIYISTAYVNCYQITSDEQLYTQPFNWKELIALLETLDPESFEKLWKKLQQGFPNTYCFTKNLAEHCVNDFCNNKIPSVIYRPTLVQCMVTPDPLIGWIDNYNGLHTLILGCITGVFRCINGCKSTIINQVPVDMVTKSLVVSAWDVATHQKKSKDIDVVQCTSDGIDWMRLDSTYLYDGIKDINNKDPIAKAFWTPNFPIIRSTILSQIYIFFFMALPFYFFDFLRVLCGRKPRLYKYVKKARNFQNTSRYFLLNTFIFSNKKFYEMRDRILESDLKIWNYDYNNVCSKQQFLTIGALSVRKYLLKVPECQIEEIRKHNRMMYWIDFAVKSIMYGLALYYGFHYLVR